MADVTIADPAQLTTPAADDKIPVWDTSASQQKWIRRDDLVGSTITGGKNLVAPADGTLALIDVAQAYTQPITLPALRSSSSNTLNDDTAISFTPSGVAPVTTGIYAGLLFIWGRFSNGGNRSGIVAFRAGTTPHCILLADGGILAVTTGVLAGTTSTDGKLNVAAAADGNIYIENRTGAQISIGYLIAG